MTPAGAAERPAIDSMEPGQEAPKLRDLYGYVGYNVFLSQSLEGLLNQALFAFIILPTNETEIGRIVENQALHEWEVLVLGHDERLRRHTLGRLLSRFKDSGTLDPELEQSLNDALAERNYVIHHFFKDKLASLYSEKGQDEAIVFQRRAGAVLQRAIDKLYPLVHAELARYGYDAAYVEEYARTAIWEAADSRHT